MQKIQEAGIWSELIRFVLSQTLKDMRKTLVPMTVPTFAVHFMDICFGYIYNIKIEFWGQVSLFSLLRKAYL